jgi:hypothetical protein
MTAKRLYIAHWSPVSKRAGVCAACLPGAGVSLTALAVVEQVHV